MNSVDTIFALATPAGRSGVAIIRISGNAALQSLRHFGIKNTPEARQAKLLKLKRDNEIIDTALVVYFSGPNSFTGEDVIELHPHGSVAVINRIITELASLPHFRMAEAGEFSKRAFLNEKMDLVQAEGLVELIDSETEIQRKAALQLTGGEASKLFADLRERLVHPIAMLEAYIDFPEEDIPETVVNEMRVDIESLIADIFFYLNQGVSMERLSQGFSVVLFGEPNSGKSSLLNKLLRRDAAIVSDIAGTTRDAIEINCDIKGIPIRLADTAGIRNTRDIIEQEGIKRAKKLIENADLLVHLIPAGSISTDSLEITDNKNIEILHIQTKADLSDLRVGDNIDLKLSIYDESSIECLKEKIYSSLDKKLPQANGILMNLRQRSLLSDALNSLEASLDHSDIELKSEFMRQASHSLTSIVGVITVDDVLDIVFSSFCIGK